MTYGQTAYVSRESMTVNLSNWNFVNCCHLWNFPFNILVDHKWLKVWKKKQKRWEGNTNCTKRGNDSVMRALAALIHNPSLVPSTSVWGFTTICNSFQKIWKPPLITASIYMHAIHINSRRHMHINNKITVSPRITQKTV